MRTIMIVATSLVIALTSSSAVLAATKQCRDAKGKFIKCETATAAKHCRDIKTKKFAKCGAPGTEALP